jgi:hypothetical protein
MKTCFPSLAAVAMFAAGTLIAQAQDGNNPLSANAKQSWTDISKLLNKMASKMPEDAYRFKPTPEVADFGQRMAHIAGANMRTCAALKGEQKTLTLSQSPTKAEILAAMKEMTDEYDSAISQLTDAELMKTVTMGRGGPRPKFAVVSGMLEHSRGKGKSSRLTCGHGNPDLRRLTGGP